HHEVGGFLNHLQVHDQRTAWHASEYVLEGVPSRRYDVGHRGMAAVGRVCTATRRVVPTGHHESRSVRSHVKHEIAPEATRGVADRGIPVEASVRVTHCVRNIEVNIHAS